MKTKTILDTANSFSSVEPYFRDLDTRIAAAIKDEGARPNEILFSSGQASSSGGQNYHAIALLIWRDG